MYSFNVRCWQHCPFQNCYCGKPSVEMEFEMIYDEPDDEEANEEDDDFLFESIRRYDTLQMFSLENIPQHVLQVDDCSICVSSQRKKGANSELLKLKLPAKLTLPTEEEGRSKENDFKVLSGVYTENLLYQIDKLENCNKILTSENEIRGLQVYSFTDCSLGASKSPDQKLTVPSWTTPNFSVIQETTQVVCSKSSYEHLIQVDVSAGKELKEIQHPFHNVNIPTEMHLKQNNPLAYNNIKCKAFDINLIAVLNSLTGDAILHDLRTSNVFTKLPKSIENIADEIWALSGCDYKENAVDYFGVISNKKRFNIYDKRQNSILFQNVDGNFEGSNGNMILKFNNKADKFSISGMNSFVEIFKLNTQNSELVFTHNGHCPRNLPSALITDHIWLKTRSKEYIISICQNGTLNCWDYKT